MRKTILRIVLLNILLLSGCHSFYQIDANELSEISRKDVIQIKFENGETINVTNVHHTNITKNQELEIIKQSSTKHSVDSVRTLYSLNAIKEIRVKKVDVQKTIFASFWITISAALVIVVLFFPEGFTH